MFTKVPNRMSYNLLPNYVIYRLTSNEIRKILEEPDSEHDEDPYLPFDDENYAPQADASVKDSEIELELVMEDEKLYNLEKYYDDYKENLIDSLTA